LPGSDYFETYNLPHVRLHSLEEADIRSATRDGLVTADGKEHKLDVVLFATGFDALRGALCRINIQNAKGETLKDKYEAQVLIVLFAEFFSILTCRALPHTWASRQPASLTSSSSPLPRALPC
jgi:cation diffusion facilitator CzcD-associated flavoprotein CzcO